MGRKQQMGLLEMILVDYSNSQMHLESIDSLW